jgi:hypothetical protein
MDKYIKEDGGAGDWGTDKARAKIQQDSPGQKIKRKGKMNKLKTFREVLEGTVVEAKDWYSFNTKKLATDFAKATKNKNADDGDLDKFLDGVAKKAGFKPNDRKMDQDIANDIVFDLAKMGFKKIDAYDLNTFEVDESVDEGTLPPALQAYQDKKNGKKPKDDKDEVEEGRVKDQMVKDSEKMSKKDFTRKYGKQNADDLYEAMDDWTITVAKPVNKLKKGQEQKVKARSAFEAINKAVKLWGDPALKAAPISSFSIKKEGKDWDLIENIDVETFAKLIS